MTAGAAVTEIKDPVRAPEETDSDLGSPLHGSPRGARFANWLKAHYVSLGAAIVLSWIVVIPLVYLMIFSFRSGSPAVPEDWTVRNYRAVYANPLTYESLSNTLIYAVVVSVISIAVAGGLAWLLERTDMPWRNSAWMMMLLPIAMPGMLASMAWILLLGPRAGLINVVLRALLAPFGFDAETGPINVYSLGGMIFIESVRGSTTLFLMMVAAFRLMDPALEEAAAVSGARTAYTVRKITAKLLLPTLLATSMYAFIGALDDFETPLLIGLPAGIFLLPTLIYFTASTANDWGLASAYTTIFLLITVGMVVFYHRFILRRTDQFATVTGKAFKPRRVFLGKWRWAGVSAFVLYFTLAVGLPLFILLWASLLPSYQVPSMELLSELTLEKYREVLSNTRMITAVKNSLWVAFWVATVTMSLAFVVAWAVVRQRVKGRVILDSIAFIPHAIPAVVVAVAMIAFYLTPGMRWLGLYGGLTVMILALITRYIAFATRTSNGSMTQIDKSLEEVAYVSGVNKLRVLLRVTVPLLFPAFIAGWIFVAAHAFRNLSVPLLMSTPRNEMIAVTLFHYWERQADFSLAAALGVMLVVGLALLTLVARRLIVKGYSGNE